MYVYDDFGKQFDPIRPQDSNSQASIPSLLDNGVERNYKGFLRYFNTFNFSLPILPDFLLYFYP